MTRPFRSSALAGPHKTGRFWVYTSLPSRLGYDFIFFDQQIG
jgi:hypothetical protein